MRMTRLTQAQAEGFYAVHRERPFFAGLVKFMTEGPVVVMALERENAIKKLREVMGATNPGECRRRHHPQAVRGEHRAQLRARIGRAGDRGGGDAVLLQHGGLDL